MTAALRSVTLNDRCGTQADDVLVNGNQALVRALLLQRERDRRLGLNTAAGAPAAPLAQAA